MSPVQPACFPSCNELQFICAKLILFYFFFNFFFMAGFQLVWTESQGMSVKLWHNCRSSLNSIPGGKGGTSSFLTEKVGTSQFLDNWGTYFSDCGGKLKSVSRILWLPIKIVSPCNWMR